MKDIRLNEEWKLVQAANGDAPVIEEIECWLQDIKLEAMTQEGELFYDSSYGWSLLDFVQRDNTDMLQLEIQERIKAKLGKRTEIKKETIKTIFDFLTGSDSLVIEVRFQRYDDDTEYGFEIDLSRINVEVVTVND